jgi:hypothetical protein
MRADDQKGYFLHLTVDTPGEYASVVPKAATGTTEIRVATIPPPNDAEFMDGDAFLYVRRNDICLCMTTIRTGAVRDFFDRFFEAAGIRRDARDFHLVNALDPDKVALLMRKGVEAIDLKGTLHTASVLYAKRKTQAVGIFDVARKHFNALIGSPHDVGADGIRAQVILKADKRRSGFAVGYKKLERIAISIIENQEDDDDYSIITKDKQKIKPREIILHSHVELDSIGKSVDREQAWEALLRYYNELETSGHLAQ